MRLRALGLSCIASVTKPIGLVRVRIGAEVDAEVDRVEHPVGDLGGQRDAHT